MRQYDFYKIYMWAAVRLGGMANPKTAVFSIIYSYYESNKECYMSYQELAVRIGCNRRTVIRAVAELCGIGVIVSDECDFRRTNKYKVDESIVKDWQSQYHEGKEQKQVKKKPQLPKQEKKILSAESNDDIFENLMNGETEQQPQHEEPKQEIPVFKTIDDLRKFGEKCGFIHAKV